MRLEYQIDEFIVESPILKHQHQIRSLNLFAEHRELTA